MAFPVGQDGKPSVFTLAYYEYLRRQTPQPTHHATLMGQRLHRAHVLSRPLAG